MRLGERYIRGFERRVSFYLRNLGLYIENLLNKTEEIKNDEEHLSACIDWMLKAERDEGGISLAFTLNRGWLEAYPETSGYIICTLIDYYKISSNEIYLKKAIELGNWEIKIQLPEGAVRIMFPGNFISDVFDTGMVILGYTSLFEETNDLRYKVAAEKAGDWLIQVQDRDGKWSNFSYNGIPHVYHSKVAWSLFKLFLISGNVKYKKAMDKNLEWIFTNKQKNNWFNFMSFSNKEDPYTHTIAYTLQGFIEIYKLGKKENNRYSYLFDTSKEICNLLISTFQLDVNRSGKLDLLPGTLSSKWKKSANYTCITGNAQFAIIFLDIFELSGDKKYYLSAKNLIDSIKMTQKLNLSENHPLQGALAGSYPIWGGYHSNEYPNWASKFFADALIRKINIDSLNKKKN